MAPKFRRALLRSEERTDLCHLRATACPLLRTKPEVGKVCEL
jgi:hypothetical protein